MKHRKGKSMLGRKKKEKDGKGKVGKSEEGKNGERKYKSETFSNFKTTGYNFCFYHNINTPAKLCGISF